MLISSDQIRAARALKNWSQTDLADRTGLAVPTIANIELGKQMPGKNTIEKIMDAFTIGGINFTMNGVEFYKNEIFSLVGEGKFQNLLFDAAQTLENLPAKERVFLAMNAEDIATTDQEAELYKEMRRKGITLKRIISEKADISYNQFETKVIDHKYADNKGAVFIFADKIAFYTSAEGKKQATTLIITNARIAESYRKTFAYMWDGIKGQEKLTLKAIPKKKGRK